MEKNARGYFICAGIWAILLMVKLFTEQWRWFDLFAAGAFLLLGTVHLCAEKGKVSQRTANIVFGVILVAAILLFLFSAL